MSTKNVKQLPSAVKSLLPTLNGTGLPWTVENGGKHLKIRVNGRLAGVLPLNNTAGNSGKERSLLNLKSQIRRIASAR